MSESGLASAGDHPALNFLNTRYHPRGRTTELLGTGKEFLDWLCESGMLERAERSRLLRTFTADDLDAVADEARRLREWLRAQVAAWVAADAPPPAAVRRLNRILATDSRHLVMMSSDSGEAVLQMRHRWTDPRQLLALPAAAAAELLTAGEPELVRQCDGPTCTIWFYDRTRSHRRRWCSMARCGNRDKVRNYRVRATAP